MPIHQTRAGFIGDLSGIYRSNNLPHFSFRVGNFDNKLIELLVIQRYDYGVVRIMHIVEDTPAVLIERAGSNDAWDLSAWHTKAVPPSTCGFGIHDRTGDVDERDLDLASECPELIHSVDVEDGHSIGDRYFDQAHFPPEERKENTTFRNRAERAVDG
jgi:hypothetical protein